MSQSQTTFKQSELTQQILAYLADHPKAQDTVEGILHWWLLEQQIKNLEVQVEKALAELVANKVVLERRGSDGRIHYRINRRKTTLIREMLK